MDWSKKGVKNIIFDLGEVITDIHFDQTKIAFEKLAKGKLSELYSPKIQKNYFDRLETANITVDLFLNGLQQILGKQTTKVDIIKAWNTMIGHTPLERLEFVNNLRPKYKTYILSNTNPIHIEYLNNKLKKEYQIENLKPFFDQVYYSYDIGYRKPDKEIYEFVLEKECLKAEETLLIDDRLDNIESALNLGLHGFHLKNKQDLFQMQ